MLVLNAVILSLTTRRRHRRLNGRPQTVTTHGQMLNDGGQYSATIQTERILSVPFKDSYSLSRIIGKALPSGTVVI